MADTSFSDYLLIPEEVHKKGLPFNKINGICTYSFRNTSIKNSQFGINICPSSMKTALNVDKNDISYSISKESGSSGGFETIMKHIPAIQIREYVPDPRIQQIVNAFQFIKKGWNAFSKNESEGAFEMMKRALNDIPGTILKSLQTVTSGFAAKQAVNGFQGLDTIRYPVVVIPFIFYYMLMSSKTKNYYTLPYSGKIVDFSNGNVGWDTAHGVSALKTSSNSILGSLLNFFGNNIKFNTTPTWTGNTEHDFPSIEVQVDLFNDTLDSALMNFLFIHSIIPMNKFIQYHIFQLNPAVYDIKIEGYNRFYMCSAQMKCDFKGQSRTPSSGFLKKLSEHANSEYIFDFSGGTDKNKLIKIPDVYSLNITFQSLLPNSFNNYIYNYSGNVTMESEDFDVGTLEQDWTSRIDEGIQAGFDDPENKNLKSLIEKLNAEEKA